MVHLSIERIDRATIYNRDDLQRVKNELVGEENEAIELYPAESRLADASSQYHLWVLAAADNQFPFGYGGGAVAKEPIPAQRLLEKAPDDALRAEKASVAVDAGEESRASEGRLEG